jgi:hypothetical protein
MENFILETDNAHNTKWVLFFVSFLDSWTDQDFCGYWKLTGKQSLCLGKPHGNTQYGVICSGTQFSGCQIKDEKIELFVLLKHFGILKLCIMYVCLYVGHLYRCSFFLG